MGRIGRAHGVKGEVSVEPRTDEPERRFAPASVLTTEGPAGAVGRPQRLTVASLRWHSGRLLVSFAEVADRTAAESVRGLVLLAEVDDAETPADPEEFYDHQLVGLRVVTTDGAEIGRLARVVHGSGQDLLVVDTETGEVLVPFVAALVPDVDPAGGRVVVADRPGLLAPHDEA